MKKITYVFLTTIFMFLTSCVSTKSTLKNVDNTAQKPKVLNNAFVLTEKSPDGKYGYDKDFPINLGFENE